MKFTITILYCVLNLCVICQGSSLKEGLVTKLTGYVPYLSEVTETITVKIELDDNIVQPYQYHSSKIIDGHFEFEFNLTRTVGISLVIGENQVEGDRSVGVTGGFFFLEPGDSLHTVVPTESSRLNQDIIVTGKGRNKEEFVRKFNHELANQILLYKEMPQKDKTSPIQQEIGFKTFTKSFFTNNKGAISMAALNKIETSILTVLYYSMYQKFNSIELADETIEDVYKEVSAHFTLKELAYFKNGEVRELNNTMADLCVTASLTDYLVKNKLSLKLKAQYLKMPDSICKIVTNAFPDSRVNKRIMATRIVSTAKRKGWNPDLETIYTKYFKVHDGKDQWDNQMSLFKNQILNSLSNAANAYEFSLPDSSRNVRKQSEFMGKVVLLDFLFTGCGACKEIAPKLQKIEKRFHDQDVVFISISIDQTLSLFKKGIGKFSSPSALHLYTNNEGSQHPIIQYYGISAYPTLILIDRNGKIVTARAQKPTTDNDEKKLVELIQSIL